jgi:hypothetical protein
MRSFFALLVTYLDDGGLVVPMKNHFLIATKPA